MKAQGATEYLVLLAVVLIIALVGIALLGFFPGTASDAQITESQIYWKSASPISITEWDAGVPHDQPARIFPYFRLRNTGTYPIRITKILGNGGQSISQMYNGVFVNISDYTYLAPGEETFFGTAGYWGLPAQRQVEFKLGSGTSSGIALYGLTSACTLESPYGQLVMENFGFEYMQYVEGQQITKRQVGAKALTIKCRYL